MVDKHTTEIEKPSANTAPASPEQAYLDNRWQSQKNYYSKNSGKNKKYYQSLQLSVGIGAVLVPVVLTVNALHPYNTLLAAIISAGVAIATAAENIFQYGNNWRNFRQASEGLKREKVLYETKTGPYRIAKDPFRRFVERCEDIIAVETGQYFQNMDESTKKSE